LKTITIGEVAKGFLGNAEEGVTGYGGLLNIRPKYQREFIYNEKERNAVIDTVIKGFPLNVIYWAVNGDGSYEVLDGQQRTISFCKFVNGEFSIFIDNHPKAFHNMGEEDQKLFLDYELMVYFCEGGDRDKLDWFRTVNIAGQKLYEQELRNAVYTGTWLASAKTIFSKTNCAASLHAKDYVKGSPIRQDFLETALRWLSGGHIESYMSDHQHDPNANVLWAYFLAAIDWVKKTFPVYRKEMKGIDWGPLYDSHKDEVLDTDALEDKVRTLMADEDVTDKKGIYAYVLTGEEKRLNIRSFNDNQKREAYERCGGTCRRCGQRFKLEDMEGDHITPWREGGKTISENCQMLCKSCNRTKSSK
jgi:hypothetical protein